MPEPLPEDEDQRLRILLAPAAAPVADDGFSARVMARVARRARRRLLVLGAALLGGAAVAAGPLWQLAGLFSRELVLLGERAAALTGWLGSPLVLAAGVLLVVVPGLWQWLEE